MTPADPWENTIVDTHRGGDGYRDFLAAFRDLLDAASAADAPEPEWAALATVMQEAADRLSSWGAPERSQPAGSRFDLPGRGHPYLLPFVPTTSTPDEVRGTVVFRRAHLGGNGAAHGGTIPLLFDEILGHLSNDGERPIARTAYLTVNYRQITPINRLLHLDATVDRQEGRKRWVSGRLRDGNTLVADADGLFVELRPGQP